MFVGPPGVGKTMMAKESAKVLFGEEAFGRIDCAQIADKMSNSKLLGPGPGYVGYPSGRAGAGQKQPTADEIKEQDPSILYKETLGMEAGGILLIDEIEKADSDALDIMLTAFDEGYVKTSVGNVIDLRNVFIIITSNLGSKELNFRANKKSLGFSTSDSSCKATLDVVDVRSTTMAAIRDWMKPELLSRITSIVPFIDLTHEEMVEVVELEWARASAHIGRKIGNHITLSDGLKEHLATKAEERNSGARYVGRLVDSYIVDTIAGLFVDADVEEMDIILDKSSSGNCDSVKAVFGDKTYEHVITETLGE
jgi:ATP-dependent Clp protease ATP-binding subunit ClpC